MFAGVGAMAAIAGVGLAWWQYQPGGAATTTAAPFFDMSFPTPSGETMAMQAFLGKPLLLNFWATWCPPCVEEMPMLDAFYAENQSNGWQVLGIAVDQGAAVNQFLRKSPVRYPVTLAGMAGVELSRSLGNSSGGLPFTVVFDTGGRVAHRKIGRVSPQDLQQWSTLR